MFRLSIPLSRWLLPPVFVGTALCLWLAHSAASSNAIFQHFCIFEYSKQLHCFRSESFGLARLPDHKVSTPISDGGQETACPTNPLKEVEQLNRQEVVSRLANSANESATDEQDDDLEVPDDDPDEESDRTRERLHVPIGHVHLEIFNETQLHSLLDDKGHLSKQSTRRDIEQLEGESKLLDDQTGKTAHFNPKNRGNITKSIGPNENRKLKHINIVMTPVLKTANSSTLDSQDNESSDQTPNTGANPTDQKTERGNNSSFSWSIPLHSEADGILLRIIESMRRTTAPRNELYDDGAWARAVKTGKNTSCDGRKIYIYDLPSKFNTDLITHCDDILSWYNWCKYVVNNGMGEPFGENPKIIRGGDTVLVPTGQWYSTIQFALEMIFHARLQQYECRTLEPEKASAFYVPFYGGMDVLRFLFRENITNEQKDKLSLELIKWLQERKWWRRRNGYDHVLVLGRITWDFRRQETGSWGSSLLRMTEIENFTKLLVERDPWIANEIGVPYTTFFHPASDRDIKLWQGTIDRTRRAHLVSFAGESRPHQPGSIRPKLIRQCEDNSASCFVLHCSTGDCEHPENLISLFAHSEFCLQPYGDSATRRSFFDSLIAGCVPVLFSLTSAYFQYPWHLPADPATYSVYIPEQDVIRERDPVNVVDLLQRIPQAARAKMRRTIINEVMPGLLYATPGARLTEFKDAVDIALDQILLRVGNNLETFTASSKA